ncbi:DUF6965 family protein [Rufibacter tibetensis]|uniref:DUF6965 family protein n=1 Tax=Rufibacter tibetensis TaxID=512763 RepID=UPI000A6619FC|nr:hypothetical protein [Rufibacter tibetensis]
MAIPDLGVISDLRLFVSSHLSFAMANFGKNGFLPYIDRLQQVRRALEAKSGSS